MARRLWRLHIRPGGENRTYADKARAVDYCLRNSIIGMGWGVPDEAITQTDSLDWYRLAYQRRYRTTGTSLWKFAEALIGDLVWCRDLKGRYYLAELTSRWEYLYEDANAIACDVVNFRHARLIKVGLADAVPGKIIACFRPMMTFQPIKSPGMLAFSEKLAGLPVSGDAPTDLYEFLSDQDIENIVFVYLQVLGWYVMPGTRAPSTAHYEFVLVHREDGARGIVQVKSGETWIDATLYRGDEKAFLFAYSGQYGLKIPDNVEVITKDSLYKFMRDMPKLLPRSVHTWIEMVGLPNI